MDSSLRRLTGPLLGLGFGLGLMVGAGIWLGWGGSSSAMVESADRFGPVMLGRLQADGHFLIEVGSSATTDDVLKAIVAAGMAEQANEMERLAKGRGPVSGFYVVSHADTSAQLVERLMRK